MFRSLALAIGVTLAILGLECIVVEKFIMADEAKASALAGQFGSSSSGLSTGKREYEPPEWMPWSLMSAGAIVMIYSFTIPRRVSG